MPAARMLMATPETTWSTPKVTVAIACSRPPSAPNSDAADDRGAPAPLVAGPAGAPGAEDHHALEADVDHAGALGEQPAEGGQPDRHGQQQGGAKRRGRRQRLLAGDHPDQRRTAPATPSGQPEAARRTGPPPVSRSVSGPRLGRRPGCVTTVLMPALPAPRRAGRRGLPVRRRAVVRSAAAAVRRRGGPRRRLPPARPSAAPAGGRSRWR